MAAPFDLITEAKRLIRFNTVTWNSNAECAVYVGSLLRKAGLEVSYQDSRVDGTLFTNVIGFAGRGKKPLLLATHLDTVDPGDPKLWTQTGRDPWKLTARGDVLYGLGAADTKLDLLCKLHALSGLSVSSMKRPVMILGTFGEESGLRGAARFCQGEWPAPEMALVGEPSELSLVSRHKGLAVVEILLKSKGLHRPNAAEWVYDLRFIGQAAHSSTPDLGENALDQSRRFLESIRKRYQKMDLLSWIAGTGHNVIPASAAIRLSLGDHPKVRFPSNSRRQVRVERLQPGWYPSLPWEDLLWCMETAQGLFSPLEKVRDRDFQPPYLTWNATLLRQTPQGWSLIFDARPLPGQSVHRVVKTFEGKLSARFGHPGPTWQFHLERDNPPLDLDGKNPLIRLASSALRAARLPVKKEAKSGCSEAGLYAKVGIPSVVIGPGRATGNIHRPNESIRVGQLKQAVRFYKAFLERACF